MLKGSVRLGASPAQSSPGEFSDSQRFLQTESAQRQTDRSATVSRAQFRAFAQLRVETDTMSPSRRTSQHIAHTRALQRELSVADPEPPATGAINEISRTGICLGPSLFPSSPLPLFPSSPLPCPGIVQSGARLKSEDLFESQREKGQGPPAGTTHLFLPASAPKATRSVYATSFCELRKMCRRLATLRLFKQNKPRLSEDAWRMAFCLSPSCFPASNLGMRAPATS